MIKPRRMSKMNRDMKMTLLLPASEEVPVQRKTLEMITDKTYNDGVGSLACQKKGVPDMASQSKVKSWSLIDDKGTWVIRARIYHEDSGKIINKSISTKLKVKDKTKRKANELAKSMIYDIEQELKRDIPKHDTTFAYYVNGWLDNKDITTRANTAKAYRDYANKHVLPSLGRYQVRDITWRVLQRFYNELLKTHKVVTVKKFNIVVSGALEDAIRDGAIDANPSSLVKWPKRERYEARVFSKDEAVQLLEAAQQAGEPMRAAITLGLCYGLRRSEVCGLRWMDIDFEHKTMHIQHTVTQNGTVRLDDDHTKTTKSKRVISLIGTTIPYLKSLRSEQLKIGLPLDKVVVWPDGRAVRPDGITRMFKTLLKNSGLDTTMRFHDTRHTAASLLAAAGVPPKQLQAFLGHDDISVTLDVYVHNYSEDTVQTSGQMDEILKDALSCSENCSEPSKVISIG